MGTKPVRIDNRKRQKARRRRQTAAARAAVLAAALVLVAVLVVAGIIRHHKKTQTVQNDTSAQTVSQTGNGQEEQNGTDSAQGQQISHTEAAGETLAGTQVQSVTAKGYAIQVVDGVTYIGGVMIANKSYSLPESYAPGDLLPEVKEAFAVMQKAAAAQGLNIYISSGYRSYSRQQTLYNNYVKSDGKTLADTYSSRPGYSEHQTGLCFDLNTIDDSFGNTKESAWLEQHAQEYGFIIRFPKGKDAQTGYQYEPWHLRYLGIDMATKVYNSGLSLEEYLGITSEYAD